MENYERVGRESRYSVEVFRVAATMQRVHQEFCRTKCLAVGQSAVARIARFADAKSQLKRRFVYIGGEYASSEWRVREWQRMISCLVKDSPHSRVAY